MSLVFAIASVVCFYYACDALNQYYKREVVPTNVATFIYIMLLVLGNYDKF
jgi:hypothetical protein